MSETSETKYASEVEAFIRIFQTLGESVIGLFVLEIGWTLLLVLATNFIKDEFGVARVSSVWIIGVVAVFVFWFLYSGVYVVLTILYDLSMALVRFLRLLAFGLLCMVRRKECEKWLANLKEQITFGGIPRRSSISGRLMNWLSEPVFSSVRIGLASMGYSSHGGIVTAQPPAHLFGTGVRAIETHLGGVLAHRINLQYPSPYPVSPILLRLPQYIQYRPLPPSLAIPSPTWAGLYRFLLNLDVLFWGRRSDDAQSAVVGFIAHRTDRDRPAFLSTLFPSSDIESSQCSAGLHACTFSPDNPTELHMALTVCLLHAVEGRKRYGDSKRLRDYPIGYFAGHIAQAVQKHLALDVLPLLPNEQVRESITTSVCEAVSELAGRWVGQQFILSGSSRPLLGLGAMLGEEDPEGEQLLRREMHFALGKCLTITPGRAAHWFRKGALACLDGDAKAAKVSFEAACEQSGRWDALWGRDQAQDAASKTLILLPKSKLELELLLARFAAFAACAVHVGDRHMRHDLNENFEKFQEDIAGDGLKTPPAQTTIIRELLA